MEPFDYPDNDPGPQTLLTSLTPEQNLDRLHWLMSRFQGYVGLISYMGARLTASQQGLAPVLRDAAQRGLIYVDDGASSRSVVGQLAGSHNLPFVKTDIVLDLTPTPVEIDRALARLEMKARDSGLAVGFAAAQPSTIARTADWAKKVEARGIFLSANYNAGDQGEVIVTSFELARVRAWMTERSCHLTSLCLIGRAPA